MHWLSPDRERGAALIIALLVLALVVMLATSVSSEFLVYFRKVENALHSQQAYRYLLGLEGVGRQVLLTDLKADREQGILMDYALENGDEPWLDNPILFPLDYGVISGLLTDLQGRFNINTLAGGSPGDYTVEQKRFIRLLQTLPLDTPIDVDRAQELTNAVADWLDNESPPQDRLPGGGEDYLYADMTPPRRPANQAMRSVSELQWVAGFTPEIVRQLEPFVTSWPVANGVLNINTMPDRLLAMLNTDASLLPADTVVIESIIGARDGGGGFAEMNTVTALLPDTDLTGIDVKSSYFLLTGETEFLDRHYHLNSVLWRDNDKGTVKVVARSRGSL